MIFPFSDFSPGMEVPNSHLGIIFVQMYKTQKGPRCRLGDNCHQILPGITFVHNKKALRDQAPDVRCRRVV